MQLSIPRFTGDSEEVWFRIEIWRSVPRGRGGNRRRWVRQVAIFATQYGLMTGIGLVCLRCGSLGGVRNRTCLYVEENQWHWDGLSWELRPMSRFPAPNAVWRTDMICGPPAVRIEIHPCESYTRTPLVVRKTGRRVRKRERARERESTGRGRGAESRRPHMGPRVSRGRGTLFPLHVSSSSLPTAACFH